jgi:hypothetical protein
MKKIFFFISALALISFMACGPSADEEKKQQKIDDSIANKDGDALIDKLNNEIKSDSIPAASDTAEKKDSKTKKQ